MFFSELSPLASSVSDFGVGGVSFVDLLIVYERWAGERLVLEMSVPELRRIDRPISVSAVPAGPSIDIWRSCKFLGAMIRALGGGCQSLQAQVYWLGEVWSWSYVSAFGDLWCWFSG